MPSERFSRARLFAGLLVCLSIACGKSTAPLITLRPCDGPLTVAVSTGTHPSISWTPECGVNRILVDDVSFIGDAFANTWGVMLSAQLFGPPVEYGTAPDGASTIVSPRPLERGRTYHVTVLRADGTAALSSGSATFTP